MVRFYILHRIIATQFHSGFLSRNQLYSAVSILSICILYIFLVLTLHTVVCTCDNYGPYVMSTIHYIHRALLLMLSIIRSSYCKWISENRFTQNVVDSDVGTGNKLRTEFSSPGDIVIMLTFRENNTPKYISSLDSSCLSK